MFFKRKIYDEVKGFDERFYLYFEDTDFCVNIKRGYKIIYYPFVDIYHIKHGSRNYKNYLFIKYHFYKSFYKFFKKHFNQYFKLEVYNKF